MHVDFSTNCLTKKCYTPNFKAVCNVRGVVVNNKFIGSHNREELYNVASDFIYDLYGNALSNNVMKKVEKYFPDFSANRYIKIVRNAYRERCVVLLSAEDAHRHHKIYTTDSPVARKRKRGAHLLRTLLNEKGQDIYLKARKHRDGYIMMDILDSAEVECYRSADENKGDLTITNIEFVK